MMPKRADAGSKAQSSVISELRMMMGGLFINLDSVPVGLVWLKAISMFRHSFEAPLLLSVTEFNGLMGAGFDDQPVARLWRPAMRWAVHRAKRRGGLGVERNQSRHS